MDKKSWKDQKMELCILIKLISDYYGGDDVLELKSYCVELLNKNKDNLTIPLICFQNLEEQIKLCPKYRKLKESK